MLFVVVMQFTKFLLFFLTVSDVCSVLLLLFSIDVIIEWFCASSTAAERRKKGRQQLSWILTVTSTVKRCLFWLSAHITSQRKITTEMIVLKLLYSIYSYVTKVYTCDGLMGTSAEVRSHE